MKFKAYLPDEILQLLNILEQNSFGVSVVGGTVRDFFLGRELSHDFDLEVRSPNDFTVAFTKLKKLLQDQSALTQLEELKFKVLRILWAGHLCELSFPRREIFGEETGHSNFDCEFSPNLDFVDSAKRRDFSINSMMMVFEKGEFTLNDPLKGFRDLKARVLRPCGDHFSRDPVRFLRAIRFGIQLGFQLDEQILDQFPQSINQPYYFAYEAEKSGRVNMFLQQFLSYAHQIDVIIPDLQNLKQIKELFFLDARDKKILMHETGLKLDPRQYNFPIKINMQVDIAEYLPELEQLARTSDDIYVFLYQQKMVTSSLQEWRSALSCKFDLSRYAPEDRRLVKWHKIFEQLSA